MPNADGVRIGKSGAKTATYTVSGTQILSENNGSNTTYYLYDENGSPVGLTYKGTTYYYRKNLQGDIINITDSTGAKAVTYTYNAWGKLMSMRGNMELAVNNPFRYRGYYYDVESGLYYLNSRYYDPQTGRFVNADSYVSTGQGITGTNMFAYCVNNPVNMIDTDGNLAISLFAYMTFLAVSVITVATCYYISTPQFQIAWRNMCNNISTAIDNATRNVIVSSRNFFKTILENVFKSTNNYRNQREIHHIVAKQAYNAQLARTVLINVGITDYRINPLNLISLKKSLHRRLHTNKYYGWANSVVISAYKAAGNNPDKQKYNVIMALNTIKKMLQELDNNVWI